ncbi:MAG TPA: thioesterase family protein [Magnetospirillaceae bacterium]|nr:thioesterase family protein [Magnetospirillaceae bacterium]
MSNLAPGLAGERTLVVEERHTAAHLGSGGVPVYATPMMVLAMEEAALAAVDPRLEPGQVTVGYRLDVKHLAATPRGMRVTARAELIAVDGSMLTFRVEAFDELERIGEGTHVRAIISVAKFKEKLSAKSARVAGGQP